MAQAYKIKAVRSKAKDWESKFGPMKTYLIQLEGNGEPVQINKKADSPAPQVGDELFGDIEQSEYGQKFKAAQKPFASTAKKDWQPRDDKAIQAQWAIGQSTQMAIAMNVFEMATIEDMAKSYFAMIDRVKAGTAGSTQGSTKPVTEAENAIDLNTDQPINLDDIPFSRDLSKSKKDPTDYDWDVPGMWGTQE